MVLTSVALSEKCFGKFQGMITTATRSMKYQQGFSLNSEKTDLIITTSVRSSYLNQNGWESTLVPSNPLSLTYWKEDQLRGNFFRGLSPQFIDLHLVSFVVTYTTNCQ